MRHGSIIKRGNKEVNKMIDKKILEKVKGMTWLEAYEYGRCWSVCPVCGSQKEYGRQYCRHCYSDYIHPKEMDEAPVLTFGRYPFGSRAHDC